MCVSAPATLSWSTSAAVASTSVASAEMVALVASRGVVLPAVASAFAMASLVVASRMLAPATVASLVVLSAAMAPQDQAAVDQDEAAVAFACALESFVPVTSLCGAVLLAAWLVFWLGRGTAWGLASPRVSHSIARETPRVVILAIVLLALVGTARAATHQVTPSSDWRSVVSNATAGDVVEFGDGNYTAACSTNTAMLTISAGITLRAQHPGQAALDAQASSSNPCGVMFIDVASGAAEVSGLTITGGYTVGVCMHCLPIKLS
jgi:hypothetical protein